MTPTSSSIFRCSRPARRSPLAAIIWDAICSCACLRLRGLDIALAILGVSVPIVIGTFIGTLAGTTRNPIAETVLGRPCQRADGVPGDHPGAGNRGHGGRGRARPADRDLEYRAGPSMPASRAPNHWRCAMPSSYRPRRCWGYSQLRILVRHIMPNVFFRGAGLCSQRLHLHHCHHRRPLLSRAGRESAHAGSGARCWPRDGSTCAPSRG